MDPTSNEESTPWDPITGKLRAHAGLKLPKGTRDALNKHTKGLGETQGFSSASTRCPTTGASSACTTAPASPRSRRHSVGDGFDLTQPLPKQTRMQNSVSDTQLKKRSSSVPRPPDGIACGSGKRAVRFLADQNSPSRDGPSAMEAQPGRYDIDPSSRRRHRDADSSSPSLVRPDSRASLSSTTGKTGCRMGPGGQAMQADPARYDVAPRGSAAAREYTDAARHVMHMKADPRNDVLHDGSGHNADGDGQTMMGMEIKERFLDMRTAFIKIDTDFDGRITHEELMQACIDWNLPLSEATRVMNCTDVDEKGYIDFDEFAQRFDPTLEISADDDEMLRLYQEGVMGDEQPIRLAGVQHGTSCAEPLVDEAKHYRADNGDLRSRLARSMRHISDLTTDLKASRDHAAALEKSLDSANAKNEEMQGRNAELEGRNSVLRRRLEEAEEDKRRMAREIDGFWQDRDEDMAVSRMRQADLDRQRRAMQFASEEEEEDAERRRRERQLAEASAARSRLEEDESKVVFVYGLEGCQKTEAMYKALEKAKVPFQRRDFNKDNRFTSAAKKSGFDASSDAMYAPVVCLGDKCWWQDHEETQLVPFPVEVAMELRRELGLCLPTPDKVREDVDIDTEIFARFLSMQEAFLKLDDNQDGFVTEDELAARCLQWNIPTSEARRIISEADRDGKGYLDFDEFAKRFGGLWNNGNRGPLRSLAPAPHQSKPRQPKPSTSPPKVR